MCYCYLFVDVVCARRVLLDKQVPPRMRWILPDNNINNDNDNNDDINNKHNNNNHTMLNGNSNNNNNNKNTYISLYMYI